MKSVLPPRLFLPTKLFFEVLNKKKVDGIVVGGAALGLNGSHRFTRDVDINVSSFSFSKKLGEPFIHRVGSSPSRLRVTYLDPKEAIKIDLSTEKARFFPLLLKHTAVLDGVRYAKPELLLVDKIQTYTERFADARRVSDEYDIQFLLECLLNSETVVPERLQEMFLTPPVLQKFYNMVDLDSNLAHYKYFFEAVGIP